MKIKMLASLLFISLTTLCVTDSQAQMRNNVTLGDYKACVDYCKGLTNSQERLTCMEGCRFVGVVSVNVKALSNSVSLVNAINKKQSKEGEFLFYTDEEGQQFYAIFSRGGLVGYKIKDKKGENVHFDLLSIRQQTTKCFIRMPDGKLKEVVCPDVIIVVNSAIDFY